MSRMYTANVWKKRKREVLFGPPPRWSKESTSFAELRKWALRKVRDKKAEGGAVISYKVPLGIETVWGITPSNGIEAFQIKGENIRTSLKLTKVRLVQDSNQLDALYKEPRPKKAK